jgi:hypothetical protein
VIPQALEVIRSAPELLVPEVQGGDRHHLGVGYVGRSGEGLAVVAAEQGDEELRGRGVEVGQRPTR